MALDAGSIPIRHTVRFVIDPSSERAIEVLREMADASDDDIRPHPDKVREWGRELATALRVEIGPKAP